METGEDRLSFKDHLEKSWKLTIKYIAPLIIMTLVMFLACFLTLGVLSFVMMAGYFQSILQMLREGREPQLKDLFSYMRLFFPLLGFTVVVFIAALIGFSLFFLPGLAVVLAVSYCCLFMLPLMTDKNLGLMKAIKASYSMVMEANMTDMVAVYLIFIGLMAIGSSVFIGFLLTQPFASVFLLSVYEEKIGAEGRAAVHTYNF
ncbi:MAG: hypothetical protein AMK71_12920 [Nitrospira bacterium SG8_35_4]|nr:MAG: hypothetical protein AMK71_12920 [Nitrospira bacterium SG8_35_4]